MKKFITVLAIAAMSAFGLAGCTAAAANTVISDAAQLAPVACEVVSVFNIEAGAVCSGVAGSAVGLAQLIEGIIIAESKKTAVAVVVPTKPSQITYCGNTITISAKYAQYTDAIIAGLNQSGKCAKKSAKLVK